MPYLIRSLRRHSARRSFSPLPKKKEKKKRRFIDKQNDTDGDHVDMRRQSKAFHLFYLYLFN